GRGWLGRSSFTRRWLLGGRNLLFGDLFLGWSIRSSPSLNFRLSRRLDGFEGSGGLRSHHHFDALITPCLLGAFHDDRCRLGSRSGLGSRAGLGSLVSVEESLDLLRLVLGEACQRRALPRDTGASADIDQIFRIEI